VPGKALLLVEDDELLREVLEQFLREHGFEVHAAGDGVEALEIIISDGVRPAVIVLDLRLPSLNGWELVEVLDSDRLLSAVPIVVITGASSPGLNARGRTSVLRKPFASSDLVRELRRWCDPVN
jgi:chemosensory pili system protein ChpA (sensor histidine kinase/response regulator)